LKKLLQYIPSNELYYFGLLLFAASLPLSKFTVSLAQFIIAGNWLLQGNFKNKWDLIKQNKIALILMSLYAIHLIGLWNTSNFAFAFKDLKTKSPILVFPLLMATSKALDRKQVNQILFLLLSATLVSSLISLTIYLGLTGKVITDIRQISPLISHIRLALLVCVAVAIAVYFINNIEQAPWSKSIAKKLKFLMIISVIWMIIFLIILESLTGLFVLVAGFFVFCVYKIVFEKVPLTQKLKYAFIVVMALILGYTFFYYSIKPLMWKDKINIALLPKTTINGNNYTHFINEKFTENGHFYGLFQCESELKKAWNSRSHLAYDSLDEKQQMVNFTIMRYLSSKNLSKDSMGIWQLSQQDINYIEKGIPNYKIPEMNPLESRAYQVYCEYQSFKEGYN
jgi:hypothetical protein